MSSSELTHERTPSTTEVPKSVVEDINELYKFIKQIKMQPDALLNRTMEDLRKEMEQTSITSNGIPMNRFQKNSSSSPSNWRNGNTHGSGGHAGGSGGGHGGGHGGGKFNTSSSVSSPSSSRSLGRYQSKFNSGGNMQDKILNTVIGNKLNSFTPVTYNDTRDFIYQIMDSGETEFIKDFVEKVFKKATLEDLYCGLFAKLIAEIAHRYPVMRDEMKRYHNEFMKIFDNVIETATETNQMDVISQKQYRLGYGQFLSELASHNTLEKEQLMDIVSLINDKIWSLTSEEDKSKTVEEYIDCLTRLTKSLKERSPKFYTSVKEDIRLRILEKVDSLIAKSSGIPRPSLTNKARFGLMDLKDLIV